MSDPIRIKILYGRVEIRSRITPVPGGFIGEGRSIQYDEHEKVMNDSGWQPNGIRIYWPEQSRRNKWWEFWK